MLTDADCGLPPLLRAARQEVIEDRCVKESSLSIHQMKQIIYDIF